MDSELIFWIVATISGLIGFGALWCKAKQDLYVDWIGDGR